MTSECYAKVLGNLLVDDHIIKATNFLCNFTQIKFRDDKLSGYFRLTACHNMSYSLSSTLN